MIPTPIAERLSRKVNDAPYPMLRMARKQSKFIDRGQIEKSPGMRAAALWLGRVEMKFRGKLRLFERHIFVVGYGHRRGFAEHGHYRGGHPRRTYYYGGRRYDYGYVPPASTVKVTFINGRVVDVQSGYGEDARFPV